MSTQTLNTVFDTAPMTILHAPSHRDALRVLQERATERGYRAVVEFESTSMDALDMDDSASMYRLEELVKVLPNVVIFFHSLRNAPQHVRDSVESFILHRSMFNGQTLPSETLIVAIF